MAIYRGTGGSSTTTDETTINAVNQKAAEAATSASNAASSASSAATSASNAGSSATSANTSASTATTAATQASASKDAAALSATNAAASKLAAETAQTAAEAAETNAILYGNMANTAAGDADADRILAEAAATSANTYAAAALVSANNAASYDASVEANATAAALSETNAAASETAAALSESNAASSEIAAAASAIAADASANDAATSEANAAASEMASATSAASASTSATTATTQATAASTSASAAATSASNAATSETNASASESAAASSATAAQAAQDAALAALDSFDDRYLGTKASDPTLDNDGNALVAGALYFNTTDDVMKVYEGSSWVAAYASLSGALLQSNNLSDLQNAVSARTNLGLGTAATTASTDYATAAQGVLADSAIQAADLGTAAYTASTDYATAAQGALADSALQSFTETDPVYTASSWYTTTNNSSNWNTAYGWGDHALAGYADAATVTTALDGKVDDAQVLTNVPAGAVFTDTTYSVGNGGLTEINFTSARSSKLDGIEAGATADQTITAGSGLSGGGTGNVTLSHADTSAQASVNNSGTTFIQDITLDTYGHITGIGSASVTIPDFVPSGTAMLFQQTSAPTGWTKSTTHNDKALRVVSGTASSGGTTAFSTAMGTPSVSGTVGISGEPAVGNLAVSVSGNIAGTTLSVNTLPSHSHNFTTRYTTGGNISGVPRVSTNSGNNYTGGTSNTGNNGAHGHSHNLSGTLNGAPSVGNLAGSLSSATAAINVQYVDIIIATKD